MKSLFFSLFYFAVIISHATFVSLHKAQSFEKTPRKVRLQLISHFRPPVILLCTYLLIIADPTFKNCLVKIVKTRCGYTPDCSLFINPWNRPPAFLKLCFFFCSVRKTQLCLATFRVLSLLIPIQESLDPGIMQKCSMSALMLSNCSRETC